MKIEIIGSYNCRQYIDEQDNCIYSAVVFSRISKNKLYSEGITYIHSKEYSNSNYSSFIDELTKDVLNYYGFMEKEASEIFINMVYQKPISDPLVRYL